MVKRHRRATQTAVIISMEALHISNVAHIDPKVVRPPVRL